MKTSVAIKGIPTVLKAFTEATIRIQNYLDELEACTEKNPKVLFNKGQVQDSTEQWV